MPGRGGARGVGAVAVAVLVTVAAPLTAGVARADGGSPTLTVWGGPAGAVGLGPGASRTDAYSVRNDGGTPLRVSVLTTGLRTEGRSAAFTGAPSAGLAVAADPAGFVLAPGESRDVRVRLAVAPGVAPGGRYAGVVFREVSAAAAGPVTVAGEIGRPVLVHVPGPVRDDGTIVAFRPRGTSAFEVAFRNTGTVDYRIQGTVRVTTPDGAGTVLAVPSVTVLPGDTRLVEVRWQGPRSAGTTAALLQLRWGTRLEHAGTARATLRLTAAEATGGGGAAAPHHGVLHARALPWAVVVVAGLLVLLLLVALLLEHQRRRLVRRLLGHGLPYPRSPAEPERQRADV